MTSILTQALVFERHGARLNIEQLAQLLGLTKGAIHNQISDGTFPIPTYLDAGKRWADYRDVAAHVDKCRERAKVAA
jgi:predicted DNA-binding transcriptional regulator AlpA